MVYRPAETPLLHAARTAGCKTVNGLGMLLHQGAKALEMWTGRTAPLEVMRRALEENVYGPLTNGAIMSLRARQRLRNSNITGRRCRFIFWSLVFFAFGCPVGSFLNVCIYRMPLELERRFAAVPLPALQIFHPVLP